MKEYDPFHIIGKAIGESAEIVSTGAKKTYQHLQPFREFLKAKVYKTFAAMKTNLIYRRSRLRYGA
ncbi:MAG TPA: hypothetical protein VE090_06090 [Methylomirabilota bacterium]|nr:hypothetical protein [Methylomirabilota bacterium]